MPDWPTAGRVGVLRRCDSPAWMSSPEAEARQDSASAMKSKRVSNGLGSIMAASRLPVAPVGTESLIDGTANYQRMKKVEGTGYHSIPPPRWPG